MGCTFTVSLDELRQVASTLSRSGSELTALADVREDYDCILGSERRPPRGARLLSALV